MDVFGIAPDATVYDAISLMAERNVGAVIVLEDRSLVGIVSERDYARKIILLDRSSRETPVSDIMTSRVETVSPSDSIDRCMELMTDGRFRHLPVVDDGVVVGVVSIGDVVKAVIERQQALIGDLERYITG
jgi:CBS domain-containing protein